MNGLLGTNNHQALNYFVVVEDIDSTCGKIPEGSLALPALYNYDHEERKIFVEVAMVNQQVEIYKKKVEALKEARAAGSIIAPQILQNTEDALMCYERLHLSLRMLVHDVELKHRHDPK